MGVCKQAESPKQRLHLSLMKNEDSLAMILLLQPLKPLNLSFHHIIIPNRCKNHLPLL